MNFSQDSSVQTNTALSVTGTTYKYVNTNDLSNKQDLLSTNTNLLGIGTSITALNYNNITLNKPTNFQCDYNSTLINKPTNFQCDYNTTLINKPTNFQCDYNTTLINKPDLSIYAIKTNVDASFNNVYTKSYIDTSFNNVYTKANTDTLLNTKQNIITAVTPLIKDVSNNLTIDLSAYPLKTYVDGSLNTINTTLSQKQNIITAVTPLIKDVSNNITIDLSAYPLKTYVDGSLNTINTTLSQKQNIITAITPLIKDVSNNLSIDLSGYALKNALNASNVTSGILSITYGGIGTATLSANQILIGNAATSILQSANLTWNNTSNTLSATNFIGSGTGISALNASNITSGTLTVSRGGIGTTTLTSNQLLIGNGTNALLQSANLTWNNTSNTLSATNFIGSGTGITNLDYNNISLNKPNLSVYSLQTYVDGSLNTVNTTLSTKQNNLTFSNPFLNTSNTISLKINTAQFNIDASGNLSLVSSYLPLSGGTLTGSLTIGNSGTNKIIFNDALQDIKLQLYSGYGLGIQADTLLYTSFINHKFMAGTTQTMLLNGTGNLTLTGNIDCGGGIAINGSNAFFGISSVDAANITNTFLNLKYAGSNSDWCYLRQIGGDNAYKLAFDFHDDNNDARFCIRTVQSTNNPDTATEVFLVDNGNVSCSGNISCSGSITATTIQEGGTNLSSKYLALSGGTISSALTINGQLTLLSNIWHKTDDGIFRFYYNNNGTSFFHSGNTNGDGFVFRNTAQGDILTIRDSGNVTLSGTLTSNNIGIGQAPTNGIDLGTDKYLRINGSSANDTKKALSIGGYGLVQVDGPGVVGGRFQIDNNGNVSCSGNISCSGAITTGNFNSFLGGLRINGSDTGNTIWQATGNLGISANTGNQITFNVGNGNQIASFSSGGFNIAQSKGLNFIQSSTGNWLNYIGTTPNNVINSLIFRHIDTGMNSYWWFNGTQTTTQSEISDERIKKEIQDIDNPIDKLMKLKPKQYFLCDEKDYDKKFGIIAQDVEKEFPEFIYTDEEFIANIYSYATCKNKKIIFNKNISDIISIDDELKIVLDNNDKQNLEIIIDDTPFQNRYKRRFVKVINIIDDYTIEIDNKIREKDIFVYGKKVNDFKKLDYQSLYCLNIAATKELFKMIQDLKTRIEILEKNI